MMRLYIKEIRGQHLFIWCWTAPSAKANCKYITAAYNEQVCISLRGEGSKPAPKNAQASEERTGRLWPSHKRPMQASPTAFVHACAAIRKTPHTKRWTTAWWHCSRSKSTVRREHFAHPEQNAAQFELLSLRCNPSYYRYRNTTPVASL